MKQQREGYELLKQATQYLEEVIGPAAATAKAEWDRTTNDKGHKLYTLRLSDWTGSVTASFTPEELKFLPYLRIRLYRLWGDLLQVRSDVQHRKVQKLVQELGQEAEGV